MTEKAKPIRRHFIAHKDGHWAGIACCDSLGIGRLLAEFVRAGFSISVYDDESAARAAVDGMKHWREHPSQVEGGSK